MDLHDLLDNLLSLDPVRREDGGAVLRDNPGTRTATTTGSRGNSITPTTYRGEPVVAPEEKPRINDIDIEAILREANKSGSTPMFRLGADDRAVGKRGISRPTMKGPQGESRDMMDALAGIRLQQLQEDPKAWATMLGGQAKGKAKDNTGALMKSVTDIYSSPMSPEQKLQALSTLNTISGGKLGEGLDPRMLQSIVAAPKKKKESGWGFTGPMALAGTGLGLKLGSVFGLPGWMLGGAAGTGLGMAADAYFEDDEEPSK